MKQFRRIALWCAPLLALGGLALPGSAITITMEYTDEGSPTPHPENPAWDPAGTFLKAHFARAKQIWEQLLPGPGDYEFDFHWDDDIGTSLGLTTDTAFDTFIEINPNQPWFADPTLSDDSEFSFADQVFGGQFMFHQRTYGQLSGIDQSTYFPGSALPNTLETLYRGFGSAAVPSDSGQPGINAATGYDLLSTIVHEMGHVLGIYGVEPGEYNIDPQHVGGITDVLVLEGDGGHLAGNRNVPGFLMCDGCGSVGIRRVPSATDILVIAEDQGISDVHLKRIGRISSGAWHTAGAWIGSDVPTGLEDAYISYNQTVTLDQDAAAKNLLVAGGSTLVVGDRIMSSAGTFDFSSAAAVTVDAGGIIYANKIVRGDSDLGMASGSSLYFNTYEGGSGTTATFNSRVAIGTGTGVQPAFDPTTIKTWTIAAELSVGDGSRRADFIINDAMTVTSGSGRVGTGSFSGSSGNVTVDGVGSRWTTNGPLNVGSGTLFLGNYGRVNSQAVQVGAENGLAYAHVTDHSIWEVTGDLAVGPASLSSLAQGTVYVRTNADLRVSGNAVVRGTPTRAGEITMSTGGSLRVDGNVSVSPYGIVTYRDNTLAHGGALGSKNFETLGGADDSSGGGIVRFYDTARAGDVHIVNRPGNTYFAGGGDTRFYGQSTAGNDENGHGQYDNYPGTVSLFSGATHFFDFASAGRAKFYNFPGPSPLINATIEFKDDSSGANGTFVNLPGVHGQSSGGAIIFRNRAKAGNGTYSSDGEGGTITFYNNSNAEYGTFSTADNIGGNSSIQFFGTSKGDHGVFTIRANTSLQFHDTTDAQHAIISIKSAKPGFGPYGGLLSVDGGTLGDAPITVEGAASTGYYGGQIGVSGSTATAGNATITLLGGSALNAGGGTLRFDYSGSAGTATIEAFGGTNQGQGSIVEFARAANGPGSKITLNAGSTLNVGGNRLNGGTTIGRLQGAGQVLLGGSLLQVGGLGFDDVITGVISDDGAPDSRLTKLGAGTLTLAGANTYTGLTTVSAGTLSVTGSLAGDVVVGSGATLKGSGNIAGVVTANAGGNIDPGTSPGTLTVGGLQLQSGSHLRFELGTVRDHIVLTGGGNVSLAGILDLSLEAGYTPDLYQVIPLFEGAIGTVSGAFSAVNSPLFARHKVTAVYGPNSVTLHVIDAAFPPGDFNGNGVVDAADYVVWRKGLGTIYTQAHYDLWRSHFGETLGSGAEAGAPASVPEPLSAILLSMTAAAILGARRSRC